MAKKRHSGFEVSVDDVVRWGQRQDIGFVKEIRVVNTAKFVNRFSGDEDAVMLRMRTELGTALIWPKEQPVSKVNDRDAKEFRARFRPGVKGEIESLRS